MQYVKDNINTEFSVLRNDCLAYPIIACPNEKSLGKSYYNSFKYKINVDVPKEYTVGCGGVLKGIKNENERKIYLYESNKETDRFDICISEYSMVKDEDINLTIFAFPKDKRSAKELVKFEVKRVYDYYKEVFGNYSNNDYFTIIETKEGYGSQAGDNYIVMEEHGFNEESNFTHLYHEIGHIWNANVKLYSEQRSRFFDEAFASYYEILAIKEFFGRKKSNEKMEQYRETFINNINQDYKNFSTPICEYGKYEMGYNSYSKGPWVLYVLHNIVGDKKFFQIIKKFLYENKERKVTFKDFEKTCERVSGIKLKNFFNQWIYGVESSRYLYNNLSVDDMVEKAYE